MTIYELHLGFLDRLDKINNSTTPELTVYQIDRYLNLGVERFIKQKYSGLNTRRLGYEEGRKRFLDVNGVVVSKYLEEYKEGNFKTKDIKSIYFELPKDYWWSLSEIVFFKRFIDNEECEVEKKDIYIPINIERHLEFEELIKSPFHKPSRYQCFRLIKSRKLYNTDNEVIELYYNKLYEPSKLFIIYVRQFDKIAYNTNYKINSNDDMDWKIKEFWLPLETHQEIIDSAVECALENLQEPRYSSFMNIKNTNE